MTKRTEFSLLSIRRTEHWFSGFFSPLPSHCTAWTTVPYIVLNISEYVQNRLIGWRDLKIFIWMRIKEFKIKHIFIKCFGVITNVLVFYSGDTWSEFQTGLQLAWLNSFGFLRYRQTKSSISFSLPLLPFQFISYPTIYDRPSALLTLMHQITHKTRFIIHNVTA